MMKTKHFFLKNLKTLQTIRTVLAIALSAMIVIDIVLVMLGAEYPTFSEVVKSQRSQLIWLNFLLGGLIGKVFYNRVVTTKKHEVSGFFAFLALLVLLGVLGQLPYFELRTEHQLLVMVCGAFVAQRIWPQYILEQIQVTKLEKASLPNE